MYFSDLHCDTIHKLYYNGLKGTLQSNDGHVDLQRLKSTGYNLQVFAAFVKLDMIQDPYESCITLLDALDQNLEPEQDQVVKVLTARDLDKPGLKVIYSVEEGGVIGESEDLLDDLHKRGVRAITLTWNFPNSLGFPNVEFKHMDSGLTPFGKKMVEKMEHMGIVPDVSHLSDKGFWDVADIATKPFIASHSNAREVHMHSRNLSDDQIRKIAMTGGVIGLNFCAHFLDGSNHMTVEALLKHFEHIYQKGGTEVLSMGSDFDGITDTLEIEGCQGMPQIVSALEKSGYSEEIIEKALWRNAHRVFRETLPK